jgi:hypothetical protein
VAESLLLELDGGRRADQSEHSDDRSVFHFIINKILYLINED